MKYIDKDDIFELIKKINNSSDPKRNASYELLSKYEYGQFTVRDFNNRSVQYNINIITNAILKQKWDEKMISVLENLNLISANNSGMHYYQPLDSRYMGFADVFAFALNNMEKLKLDKEAITYLNDKLRNKDFYMSYSKDDQKFYGFKDDNLNRDTPHLALYGIRHNNSHVLNFIYPDMIKNKNKYIYLVASQIKFANFKNMIEHFEQKDIDWENNKNIKISSVSKIFISSNFLLELAKLSNLSNSQKDIIDYIFEKDPKLMKKTMSNAGNKGIYEKSKDKQKESKDLFLVALHNQNYAFIEALLKNGYMMNSNEKSLGDLHGLDNKVESIEKRETSKIVQLNDKINNMLLNGSSTDITGFVKSLSKEDLEELTRFQNDFSYTAILNKKLNSKSDSEPHTHLIKLSSNADITPLETLMCKQPEIMIHLSKKGFEAFNKEVGKYAIKRFFDSLYFHDEIKYNEQVMMIKCVYGKLNDIENILLTDEILKARDASAYAIMINADKAVFSMIQDDIMKISEESKPVYASRLPTLYSTYSVEEKKSLYGKDKSGIDDTFLNNYIDKLSKTNTDKNEQLIRNILTLIEKEEDLQQKAIQKMNKKSSNWNDLSTVIAQIERQILTGNTKTIVSSPAVKNRL